MGALLAAEAGAGIALWNTMPGNVQEFLYQDAVISSGLALLAIPTTMVGAWAAAFGGDSEKVTRPILIGSVPAWPLLGQVLLPPYVAALGIRKGLQAVATGTTKAINGVEGAV